MGCTNSTNSKSKQPKSNGQPPVQTETAPPPAAVPETKQLTPEEKALSQLRLIFDGIDADADGTVDKIELGNALEKDTKLKQFVSDAGFQANGTLLEKMDTDKDGRLTWNEFEASLKAEAVKEVQENNQIAAAELPAEERALKQLRMIFDGIDVNGDKSVDRNELTEALKKDASLAGLITESGLNSDYFVLDQMDVNLDGKVTWEEFEYYLKEGAKKQVQETGEVAAAIPLVQVDEGPTLSSKGNMWCC